MELLIHEQIKDQNMNMEIEKDFLGKKKEEILLNQTNNNNNKEKILIKRKIKKENRFN